MLAKNQKRGPTRIDVRYYLCSKEGLQRITQRLHRSLVEGDIALPQFAGTKQKILEVLVKPVTSTSFSLTARGVLYPFDERGFLDVSSLAREGSPEISRFRSAKTNVVDLTPSLKKRRYQETYTWKPSKGMIDRVWEDVEPNRGRKRLRVPILRPFGSRRGIR